MSLSSEVKTGRCYLTLFAVESADVTSNEDSNGWKEDVTRNVYL